MFHNSFLSPTSYFLRYVFQTDLTTTKHILFHNIALTIGHETPLIAKSHKNRQHKRPNGGILPDRAAWRG